MPRVKKLRVVAAKHRKKMRDRYYSVDNLARRKSVEKGTHRKNIRVTMKHSERNFRTRENVESSYKAVHTVKKNANQNVDEESKLYFEFSTRRIMPSTPLPAIVVNEEDGMDLESLTPTHPSVLSGFNGNGNEDFGVLSRGTFDEGGEVDNGNVTVDDSCETEMEMEGLEMMTEPTPEDKDDNADGDIVGNNEEGSEECAASTSIIIQAPSEQQPTDCSEQLDVQMLVDSDNPVPESLTTDIRKGVLKSGQADRTDDYLTTEDEDDLEAAENVKKVVKARERRNRRWLNGDDDDVEEKKEDNKYANYSDNSQPQRFQDYVKWKHLYSTFMGTGDKIMETEIFDFQKMLKENPNPQCQVLQDGCIPWDLITKVKEVRPTLKTMTKVPFEVFIKYLQWKGWHYSGLTKVIPPEGFMLDGEHGFDKLYGNPTFTFPSYTQTAATNSSTTIAQMLFDKSRKIYNVQGWYNRCKVIGQEMFYLTPQEREQHLMDTILTSSEYAKDIDKVTTLFPLGQPNRIWNPTGLNTVYKRWGNWDHTNPFDGYGLTSPYVYYGMYRSAFSWHVEDFNAWSLNYLHYGDRKIWYGISSLYYLKWLHVQKSLYTNFLKIDPTLRSYCEYLGTHKQFWINPSELEQQGVPSAKVYQEPGTFIITHDACPHSGISTGFSAAEAVNFAVHTKNWPRTAMHKHVCTNKKCAYGKNTKKKPEPWIKKDLGQTNFQKYETQGIWSRDPYEFAFADEKFVGAQITNRMGSYPLNDHTLETLEVGRRFRRIFKDDKELAEFPTYDPKLELTALQIRDNQF